MRLIDAEALEEDFYDNYDKKGYRNGKSLIYAAWCLLKKLIEKAPTIEAYTGAEYMHLLKLAKKMHTWIFLHTLNENETYKELGLTDEDNVLLGSLGKVELVSKADKFNHIAGDGKKEPICGCPQEGVKIPVISMEDVLKMLEKELPSVEENPILREIRKMRHTEK